MMTKLVYNKEALKSCGEDVFINGHVEILRPHLVEVGTHIIIDYGFYCTTQLMLSDYNQIGPYVSVIGSKEGLLKTGYFVGIAVGTKIICGSEKYEGEGIPNVILPAKYRDKIISSPIVLENFVNICANVVIFPGVKLGEGSVVGAGAIVTKDTEPWTVYIGAPAKPIKERPRDKMITIAKELGYDV